MDGGCAGAGADRGTGGDDRRKGESVACGVCAYRSFTNVGSNDLSTIVRVDDVRSDADPGVSGEDNWINYTTGTRLDYLLRKMLREFSGSSLTWISRR